MNHRKLNGEYEKWRYAQKKVCLQCIISPSQRFIFLVCSNKWAKSWNVCVCICCVYLFISLHYLELNFKYFGNEIKTNYLAIGE